LLSKIRGGIDEHSASGMFDDDRNSQTFVARIVGGAGLTFTSDRRNSRGGSSTEKGESHLPPVISLPVNFRPCCGELTSETYCIRRSARRPSSIRFSWLVTLPAVFF